MSNIQIFQSEQFGQIRTAVTESGEPLFCLADVCATLSIASHRNVRSRLDNDDVRLVDAIDNAGRVQSTTFITEPGMYTVILRSDSPKAKPMQKWVTSEVLPALRKTGGYMVVKANETPEQLMDRALMVAQETIKRTEARVKEAEAKADRLDKYSVKLIERNQVTRQKLLAAMPKVLFADAVATSDRSVLVAELAKILKQNGVDMGQNRLFEWLRKNRYLCSKGEYYNQPTQYAMDKGLFELKKTSITKPDGSVLVTTTTKITGKGQIYFVNKFIPAPLVVE